MNVAADTVQVTDAGLLDPGALDTCSAAHLLRCGVQGIGAGDAGHDVDTLPLQHQQLAHRHHAEQVLFDELLGQSPLVYLNSRAVCLCHGKGRSPV